MSQLVRSPDLKDTRCGPRRLVIFLRERLGKASTPTPMPCVAAMNSWKGELSEYRPDRGNFSIASGINTVTIMTMLASLSTNASALELSSNGRGEEEVLTDLLRLYQTPEINMGIILRTLRLDHLGVVASFNTTLILSVSLIALSQFNYGFDQQGFNTTQAMNQFARRFGSYDTTKKRYELDSAWLSLFTGIPYLGLGLGESC